MILWEIRFEEAVTAAQRAAKLEPSDEANAVAKRARAMASARLDGNELFKASKFAGACNVYSEGLQHEPLNSILLCNRAACLSKLGQYEKAVEDCSAALSVRPSYTKARLRRADCLSKVTRIVLFNNFFFYYYFFICYFWKTKTCT